ncbi:Fur family transcriptional regulator [Paraoerskovia marina]|uniref:Fur family transcriptional regulator n=1 Tax=Paraoerskovia marina TaxID=545619 RepID=UPI0004924A42|nr:Fur family transcriptional regulator [Paraoerskovia marina]
MTTTTADELRSRGLRVTAPRLAVLAALDGNPHADTDFLVRAVRERLGTVSTQAVYDVLRVLTAASLIQRIEPAGHPARYELRVGDNHHHAVCRLCGAVVDVDCSVGHAPCLIPQTDHGFTIESAEVTYWGTCPDCTP